MKRYAYVTVVLMALVAAAAGADPASVPKIEHLAWCPAGLMYLNGPRLEAMTIGRPGAGLSDDDGNVFWGPRYLDRSTDLITTFADDYWQTDFGVDEGPASAFQSFEPYQSDYATYCRFVSGRPLEECKEGEKDEKGCIYFADFGAGKIQKVWKNPEQENRWWFKKIAGGGAQGPPTKKDGTVPALEAKLRGRMMLQVMPDGRLIVFTRGNFYEWREGNLVCIMGTDDHKSGTPQLGVLGGDGFFYLGYYYGGAGRGATSILRIHPDGTAEPYVHGRFNTPVDGDGMNSGSFCGPHFWGFMHNYKFLPPDFLMLCAHDDSYLRRARDGRVATLCPDGQWRELARGRARKDALSWFRWLRGNMCPTPGPDGTAVVAMTYISSTTSFLVTGIDYDGPVVGPRLPIPPDDSGKGE